MRPDDDQTDPIAYWIHFRDTELGKIALMLFHKITSSASVERSFSAQGRIKSPIRNRLKHGKCEKMISILFSDLENDKPKKRKILKQTDAVVPDDVQNPSGPLLLAREEPDVFNAMLEGAGVEDEDSESGDTDDDDDEIIMLPADAVVLASDCDSDE